VHHAATAITAPDTDHLPAYWQFHDAVAQAQLLAWLPRGRHMIVDVSGPRSAGAELAAAAGHRVLRVIDDTTASVFLTRWLSSAVSTFCCSSAAMILVTSTKVSSTPSISVSVR